MQTKLFCQLKEYIHMMHENTNTCKLLKLFSNTFIITIIFTLKLLGNNFQLKDL